MKNTLLLFAAFSLAVACQMDPPETELDEPIPAEADTAATPTTRMNIYEYKALLTETGRQYSAKGVYEVEVETTEFEQFEKRTWYVDANGEPIFMKRLARDDGFFTHSQAALKNGELLFLSDSVTLDTLCVELKKYAPGLPHDFGFEQTYPSAGSSLKFGFAKEQTYRQRWALLDQERAELCQDFEEYGKQAITQKDQAVLAIEKKVEQDEHSNYSKKITYRTQPVLFEKISGCSPK